MRLSAKMDSNAKDSGRLARHIMGWHLLPPFGPSQIIPAGSRYTDPRLKPGHKVNAELLLWSFCDLFIFLAQNMFFKSIFCYPMISLNDEVQKPSLGIICAGKAYYLSLAIVVFVLMRKLP